MDHMKFTPVPKDESQPEKAYDLPVLDPIAYPHLPYRPSKQPVAGGDGSPVVSKSTVG